MKKLLIPLIFVTVLIFSNLLSLASIGDNYLISSSNSEFTFMLNPSKGRDMEMLQRRIDAYKQDNKIETNIEVCREMEKNLLKFWKWYEYAKIDYWDLKKCN